MKYLVTVLIVLGCFVCKAQDTIIQRNGGRIPAKVLEIDRQDVKYKKTDNPDGPLYTISKADVNIIKYKNGSADTLNTITGNIIQAVKIEPKVLSEMYKKGQDDADKYYVKYKTPARWTLGSTIALNALGIVPTVIVSANPPQRENLGYPDPTLLNNGDYITGYVSKAHEKKQKYVMKNFAWGALCSFVLYGGILLLK